LAVFLPPSDFRHFGQAVAALLFLVVLPDWWERGTSFGAQRLTSASLALIMGFAEQ
jgi:hypothetical protein